MSKVFALCVPLSKLGRTHNKHYGCFHMTVAVSKL